MAINIKVYIKNENYICHGFNQYTLVPTLKSYYVTNTHINTK